MNLTYLTLRTYAMFFSSHFVSHLYIPLSFFSPRPLIRPSLGVGIFVGDDFTSASSLLRLTPLILTQVCSCFSGGA